MLSVGVLTMPASDRLGPEFRSYLTYDNYTWLKRAGLKVVPIPIGITDEEALVYFNQIQGLYLPGGPSSEPTYKRLAFRFLDLAAASKDRPFPIWGTCHGFQMMLLWAGATLDPIDSMLLQEKTTLRILPTKGRLFQHRRPEVDHIHLSHSLGITLAHFRQNRRLTSLFRILATSHDRAGIEYVSVMEGIHIPLYGVQFHPEMSKSLDWMAEFFKKEMGPPQKQHALPHTFSLTKRNLRPCAAAWNEYYLKGDAPLCFVFNGKPVH